MCSIKDIYAFSKASFITLAKFWSNTILTSYSNLGNLILLCFLFGSKEYVVHNDTQMLYFLRILVHELIISSSIFWSKWVC
jgi:hypothetical protein